jgi:hypothetical protein
MNLFAKPEWCPDTFTTVIILGNAAPETKSLHKTVVTDPLEPLGNSLAKFYKDRGLVPDIFQRVCGCVPEDKIRYGLPNAAEGIGTTGQNAQNS